MNTEYIMELDPSDNPAAAGSFSMSGDVAQLSRVYQQLGLNPAQALDAVRADAACGLGEIASGDTLS
jgi:hypothetical protein